VPRVSSHTARFTPREFYSVTRSTFRDGLRRCAIDVLDLFSQVKSLEEASDTDAEDSK
jgi:hypothetical protein